MAELLETYFDDSPRLLEADASSPGRRQCGGCAPGRAQPEVQQRQLRRHGALQHVQGTGRLGKAGTLEGAAEQIGHAAAEYEQVQAALEAIRQAGCMPDPRGPVTSGAGSRGRILVVDDNRINRMMLAVS